MHVVPGGEKIQKERKNNADFYQTESLFSATLFKSRMLLAVRASGRWKDGVELHVGYCNKYESN